jgi:hypothetical protein
MPAPGVGAASGSNYPRSEDDAMPRLLTALYAEHRSIAAVLSALEALVHGHRDRGMRVDPRVFRAMLPSPACRSTTTRRSSAAS